jgi:protein arginine N-methyltransferase 1
MYDDKFLQILEYHRGMLVDEYRTDCYLRSILKIVKPGDVVLDLGCGTGILSYFACMAGAKHVFAVEQGPIIELARRICQQNGYQDQITFINDWSKDMELSGLVDVIVTETIGNLGFEEGILGWIIDARHRFLKEGGSIIPRSIDLILVPVENSIYEDYLDLWGDGFYTLDFSAGRSLLTNNLLWSDISAESYLSQPVSLVSIDLSEINNTEFSGQWLYKIQKDGILHGFGGWFSAVLAPDILVSNAPPNQTPSWDHVLFPIQEPLEVKLGEEVFVEIKAINNASQWQWKVTVADTFNGKPSTKQGMVFSQNSLQGILEGKKSMRFIE